VVAGETCDDGNRASGDGCSADCLSDESCGNGVLDAAAGEVCDDGNRRSGDGCSADCLSDESCGNHVIDVAAGESCDDGNRAAGDGCDAFCHVEAGLCYVDEDLGVLDPGVALTRTLNVAVAGDEWVTGCTSSGPEVVLTFEMSRPGDIDLVFSQSGDHAIGLYTSSEVTDVCTASGGVCFDRGPDEPGEVIFMGRDAGLYYLIAEGQGPDWAGTVDVWLWVHGCAPDVDLGLLRAGTVASTSVTTLGALEIYDAGCAGDPTGSERVVAFRLGSTRDVTLSWSQTGDHVFALMEEGGGECDDHQISCHDPTGSTTGSVTWRRLAAGSYLVMVDAYGPGDEGSVSLTLEAL
jgi:cysteine-rich repeat protein